jgi:hypothetical protein
LIGNEERIEQDFFTYCVQAYPYWTDEHYRTMEEVCRLRGDKPFDLSCVGGPTSQVVAQVLGWRAGRLTNFAGNYLKHHLFAYLRI